MPDPLSCKTLAADAQAYRTVDLKACAHFSLMIPNTSQHTGEGTAALNTTAVVLHVAVSYAVQRAAAQLPLRRAALILKSMRTLLRGDPQHKSTHMRVAAATNTPDVVLLSHCAQAPEIVHRCSGGGANCGTEVEGYEPQIQVLLHCLLQAACLEGPVITFCCLQHT